MWFQNRSLRVIDFFANYSIGFNKKNVVCTGGTEDQFSKLGFTLRLLAAALAIFVLGRTTSHFSNVLNRFLKPLPKVLTDNVHRVLLVICALYVCGLVVWWIWNPDF